MNIAVRIFITSLSYGEAPYLFLDVMVTQCCYVRVSMLCLSPIYRILFRLSVLLPPHVAMPCCVPRNISFVVLFECQRRFLAPRRVTAATNVCAPFITYLVTYTVSSRDRFSSTAGVHHPARRVFPYVKVKDLTNASNAFFLLAL
jgi:hypothetical protein